ncbi:GTP-binding protein Di-Ras1-like [Branchiostoma lanceolatum]|uniref:GTP-binding protein Di-Ras1-like n=1 Tax=Branchiostoma lanceolatum TaxID=7740 RepID=UPI0034524703
MPEPVRQLRLLMLGAGGVGKTALVHRFMHDNFSALYTPTVEDFHSQVVKQIDGTIQALEIIDTGGTHNFPAMLEMNIKMAQGFLLVYSDDQRNSFDVACAYRKLVIQLKG